MTALRLGETGVRDKKKCLYLSQGVPVCDGLTRVSQHFVPVISSKTLSIWPGATHTDHLIVSNPVRSKTHIWMHIVKLLVVLEQTQKIMTKLNN